LKILLDESVPHIVQTRLSHLAIWTVQEMGWTGIKNGELLRRAEGQFDVFVTADQQLRHQQNLSGRKLAIIVIPTNQVRTVGALLPKIEESVKRA
jgi:predicted nuclease of predicted toxin-antitoxin system